MANASNQMGSSTVPQRDRRQWIGVLDFGVVEQVRGVVTGGGTPVQAAANSFVSMP